MSYKLFLLFSFFIRLFSPVRRLRRAQVLYRAQFFDWEQIPAPGERALCPERNTPVVAQYPVIAPFSSTKASKRSGIERVAEADETQLRRRLQAADDWLESLRGVR